MTRLARLRKLSQYLVLACLLLLLFLSSLVWFTTTESFQHMVRGRLIAAIERATGGRVELGSFHVVPLRFEVGIRDLTIHGRETSGAPYVHVDSVIATVNLSSVLGAKIGFHVLTLQHPVVRILFYPDGSTNQPSPQASAGVDFEQLFAISIDRLDIKRGELIWQDEKLPLEFTANDIVAGLDYSFFHRRYLGNVTVGRAETKYDGYRPVPWSGSADFAIDQNGIEVRKLTAASEPSHMSATGIITNFRNPVFKGKYYLVIDLNHAGAVTRQPELKGGTVEFTGEITWYEHNLTTTGKFNLHDVGWEDKTFSNRGASAQGKFSINPKSISISEVEGRAFHGSFTSNVEITRSSFYGEKKGTQEKGIAIIKARGISLTELLTSFGPQARPLNQLKFASDVSGTGEIRWKDSVQNAEIAGAFDASPPRRLTTGQVPLAANGRASYRVGSGDLEITDLKANTPATQVRATGAMAASSSLRISFASDNLGEWKPIISAVFPSGVPLDIHGRLSFTGTVKGRYSNPSLAGSLQIQNFDTRFPAAARASAAIHHWDSLTTDLQLSSRSIAAHNATLIRRDSTLKFDGSAGLVAWKIDPASPFRLRVDAHNQDASEAAKLAGLDYLVSGLLDTELDLSGTPSHPQGQGHFALSNGSIQGQQFDSASAVLGISGMDVTFTDLRVARAYSNIRGNGHYDLVSHAFQFNLTGSDFELADLGWLQRSKIRVGGKLDFSAQTSGTPTSPQLNADLHLHDVTLNDEILGDLRLRAESRGLNLRLDGQSNFKNSELFLNANVLLKDQWPAKADFRFSHLDIDSFLASYLHGHVTGHSAVAGNLQLRGPVLNPQQMSITGNLTDFTAELEKIKLHNEGPVLFSLNDRTARIDTFHIAGDNTDFSGGGLVQLAGEKTLDLQAQGKLDLKLIQMYDPDFSASGIIIGSGTATGTLDAPVIKGKLQIGNGAISNVNLPTALSEINGTFAFNQNQVTIETLTGKTGGGTVAFTGHAEFAANQLNFDLTASANAVRLRYPPGVSSTADAELHWNGSARDSVLSGDITVIKVGVTPGFDFATYLQRSAQTSSLPQTNPTLNRIRLDLHVLTAPELQMQTSVIRLQGDADLRVRGNAAKPVLLGRADVLEGEAYFNGTKYRLERGGVTFNNPAVTTPFVDLEATTRVRDYEITLALAGDASQPNGLKVNYRSEPPLPPADIIALLAFGQTTEQSAQLQQTNQSAFSQQASSAMLAAALNATLNNRTQRLFGVSRIKIDPQGLATETSPTQNGPAVTIEQQVKDNLTITYTTDVAQTSQQVIQAEYNISKNVSIVAIRDQNGVVSFDVKIRRRKR